MNLHISWTNPTPLPSCGFDAYYRRKGDNEYSTLATSGTTSGSTVHISAPASYEGYVKSDCCSGVVSPAAPFGVNAYSGVHIAISFTTNPLPSYIATITSTYANPYDTLITGTFVSTNTSGATTIGYTATYPADSVIVTVVLGNSPASSSETISSPVITSISPVFNNGGSLQQFDSVDTPPYFMFYDSSTSGVTWNGSPTTLPSFTLDAFNVTSQDTNLNILAGDLLISWIQESLYLAAVSPYDYITFQVKDADNVIIGSLLTTPGTLGLVNAIIPLTKAARALIPTTPLIMVTRWGNTSLISSKSFYLPG